MSELEDLLRATLSERADTIQDPDPIARAEQVIAEDHSTGGRRRAAAAGAVLVTAALVAGGVYILREQRPDAAPGPDVNVPVLATPSPSLPPESVAPSPSATRSRTPSPSATPSATPVARPSSGAAATATATTTATASAGTPTGAPATGGVATTRPFADAKSLPLGNSVAAQPRSERKETAWTFVVDGRRVSLPEGVGFVSQAVETDSGWVARAAGAGFTGGDTDPDASLLLIGPGGRTTVLATGEFHNLVPSPDASAVAALKMSGTMRQPSLVIRGSDGSAVRTINLDAVAAKGAGMQFGLDAWTADGIIVSATPYDPESTQAPLRWRIDPDGSSSRPVIGWDAVVRVGRGKVLATKVTGTGHCLFLGSSLTSLRQVGCSKAQLNPVPLSASGAVQVTPLDPSTGTPPTTGPSWLIDPDGTVHEAVAPVELTRAPTLWEAPGVVIVRDVNSTAPTWLRWKVDKGTVERAPVPVGSGDIEG